MNISEIKKIKNIRKSADESIAQIKPVIEKLKRLFDDMTERSRNTKKGQGNRARILLLENTLDSLVDTLSYCDEILTEE